MDISSVSSVYSNGIKGAAQSSKANTIADSAGSVGKSFGDVLNSLNESSQTADAMLTKLASGEDVDIADVMIASTENDVNFRVAMAIRDKLVDAYREIMRMSV